MVTAAAASHHRLPVVLVLSFALVGCGGGDGAGPVSTPPGASASANPPDNGPTSPGGTGTTAPETSTGGSPSTTSSNPSSNPPTASNEVDIGARFFDPRMDSFGQVTVGRTITKDLRVHSDAPEVVRTVVVRGAAFSIVDDGCTGATFPGPSCVVRVAATPPAPGEHEGSLTVTTSTGRVGSSDLVVVGEQPETASPTLSPEPPRR